jgi:hypothetical protein
MRLPTLRTWLAATFCTLLAACGGSGSSSQANVMATGVITGFGSVYVNGVHFETGRADISRDGKSARQNELRVGQVVHISGHIDPRNGHAVANWIRQHNNLEGPITAVDAVAQTFVVLAHTVKVTADTSFDDSITSFADLTVGLQVEVNGLPDADGNLIATRVEKRTAGETSLEVLGKIADLDTTTHRFKLDQLVVDYTAATLRDFTRTGIANGLFVEVKGNSLDAGGALLATSVELHDFEHLGDAFQRELEGLVTRFVSATDFDVSGHPVTTTPTTTFEGGTAADLALNTKVEAEGTIDANGVLVATKIEFKRSNGAGIAGLVQSTTPDATGNGGTLVVMGVTVKVDKKTRVEDRTSANVEMFGVKDIAIGDYVEVRGLETAPLQLTASRLERRPARSDVWVRGQVRDVAAPNFTALGLTIVTSASTVFEGMTSTQFFASAAGHIVKVKGTMVNNQLVANEVEFEDHEDDGDHKGGDDHGGHGGGPGGGGGGPG